MPTKKRSYLIAAIGCRCPRCRQGKLFINNVSIGLKKNMAMPKTCAVCGQPTEKEPGFYYGTGYVSYAMGVAISVATFIAWFVLIGMSVRDNRFFYWIGTNAVCLILLQPYLMRVSRTLWLSLFIPYDYNWADNPAKLPERTNKDQENNW